MISNAARGACSPSHGTVIALEGAAVALTYVNAADKAQAVVSEIEQAGGRAVAIRADNRDAEAIEQAIRHTGQQRGHLALGSSGGDDCRRFRRGDGRQFPCALRGHSFRVKASR